MRHALFRVMGRLATPLVALAIRPARPPGRVLIAPQDIRVADATVAHDIYAGHFALAGRVVNAHGRSPFEIEPPSRAWSEALQGFSWLRHLRAADTALARANGRALVDDWITATRRAPRPEAWRPAIVARRLLSWLSQSPIILDGADGGFYRRLMRSLVQQAAFLQRRLSGGLTGEARLWAALALTEVGLCTDRAVAPRRSYTQFLDELDAQILADGGHIGRDPQMLVDLLLDLLPLRQAYAARGAEVPPRLLNAIDRMLPMLRLFRHADGSLALFNGMGVTQPEALATILAYGDASAMPLTNAPYSGYQRLAAGGSVVVCDTGPLPPLSFALRAHAGTLSFEFSGSGQPLVVNCGHPQGGDRRMLLAARSTAAHSTLILADTSSARFLPGGRRSFGLAGAVIGGPGTVTMQRRTAEGWSILEASHDGYAGMGFVHQRRLSLAETGLTLAGEDELVATGKARPTDAASLPFTMRFHLHPSIRPVFAADGRGVMLALRSGTWRFEADAGAVGIEESIYFGSAEGPRRCEQIVVQADAPGTPLVRWSFRALGYS